MIFKEPENEFQGLKKIIEAAFEGKKLKEQQIDSFKEKLRVKKFRNFFSNFMAMGSSNQIESTLEMKYGLLILVEVFLYSIMEEQDWEACIKFFKNFNIWSKNNPEIEIFDHLLCHEVFREAVFWVNFFKHLIDMSDEQESNLLFYRIFLKNRPIFMNFFPKKKIANRLIRESFEQSKLGYSSQMIEKLILVFYQEKESNKTSSIRLYIP